MLEIFLLSLLIISIGIALFAIKLFFGKRFVHTHIDGNKALNKMGIHCVQSMDCDERRKNPHAVQEHSHPEQKTCATPTATNGKGIDTIKNNQKNK